MQKHAQCYDSQSCIRCYSCMVNCGNENRVRLQRDKNRPVEKTVQQKLPHLFHLNPRATEIGTYPNATRITGFHHCMHCENAPCAKICPSGAIVTRPGGSVIIMENLCVGCQSCKDACPYDVPVYSKETNKTYKCTQCHDRIENGLKQACVTACPTGALFSGTREEVQKEALQRAENYTKVLGIKHAVYGGESVNFYVGKLGWMTIAPVKDSAAYLLPDNPYRPWNIMRDAAKTGGSIVAVAALAGVGYHFMNWLKKRDQVMDSSSKNDGKGEDSHE
jgi:formate dehydrogenase iron-sulfur subunit